MKFTVDQKSAVLALKAVASATTTKGPQVLSHTLLTASEAGIVTCSATNNEAAFTFPVPADVTAPGAAAMDAKLLVKVVEKLSGSFSVALGPRGDEVLLHSSDNEVRLRCLSAAEFPRLARFDRATSDRGAEVSAHTMRRMLQLTKDAMCTDVTRPALAGTLLWLDGKNLVMTASDGCRLAEVSAPSPSRTQLRVTIPRDSVPSLITFLNTIQKLGLFEGRGPGSGSEGQARGDDVTVEMHIATDADGHPQRLFMACNGAELALKLLTDPYPNYKDMIPEISGSCLVDRDALLHAVALLQVLAGEETGHSVDLTMKADTLTLQTHSSARGSGVKTLSASYDGGVPYRTSVKAEFLRKLAASIDASAVLLEVNASATRSALMVRPPRDSAQALRFQAAIMPISKSATAEAP